MFREIADLGKEIDLALWPDGHDGKRPKVYED
jgi:hypothetical protein